MSKADDSPVNSSNTGFVKIKKLPSQGMISLRGNLSSDIVRQSVYSAVSLELPDIRKIKVGAICAICWMAPDELLILCPYAEVASRVTRMQSDLKSVHSFVVDVSDARVMFCISGVRSREVLAKLCPVDLTQSEFGVGDFRLTRLAQVPAAFWMQNAEIFNILVSRSVARYGFNLLKSAAQKGSEVGVF
ncbi:MAG: sarcosine oxidase subunit gamma [Aestuariivita sp.]|nr:sarcosine oxidase subunit gamma [Aestuariivita sp.]